MGCPRAAFLPFLRGLLINSSNSQGGIPGSEGNSGVGFWSNFLLVILALGKLGQSLLPPVSDPSFLLQNPRSFPEWESCWASPQGRGLSFSFLSGLELGQAHGNQLFGRVLR